MDQVDGRGSAANTDFQEPVFLPTKEDYAALNQFDDDNDAPIAGQTPPVEATQTSLGTSALAVSTDRDLEPMLAGDPPPTETAEARRTRVLATLGTDLTGLLQGQNTTNPNRLTLPVFQPFCQRVMTAANIPPTEQAEATRLLLRWLLHETGTRGGRPDNRPGRLTDAEQNRLTELLTGYRPAEVARPAVAAPPADAARMATLLQTPALREFVLQAALHRFVADIERTAAAPLTQATFTTADAGPAPVARLSDQITRSILGEPNDRNRAVHTELSGLLQRHFTRQFFVERLNGRPVPDDAPPALTEVQAARLGVLLQNGRTAASPFSAYANADGLAAHLRAHPDRVYELVARMLRFNPSQANRQPLDLVELQAAGASTDMAVVQVARLSALAAVCRNQRITIPATWPEDRAQQDAALDRMLPPGSVENRRMLRQFLEEYRVLIPWLVAAQNNTRILDADQIAALTAPQLRELGLLRAPAPAEIGFRALSNAQLQNEFSAATVMQTILRLSQTCNGPRATDTDRARLQAWLAVYQRFNCHQFPPPER